MAVAVVGISLSGPMTALVTAPFLAIAFWRNAAGAAALLPVLLTRERAYGLNAPPFTLDLRMNELTGAVGLAQVPRVPAAQRSEHMCDHIGPPLSTSPYA